ncbi:unnamed protein product [Phytomonas sp. Hart1]|nr:unnamed protein product [Phytomonas sp. Hart1]|eukprot:CCW67384.1 unnamed protein product [Phytomonas sp. isolate Hart1]
MNDFECFITARNDLRSGEVIYALYQRQIPVLALHIEPSGENDGEITPSSTINTPSASHIQEVLYHERQRVPTGNGSSSVETVEEAIRSFFDFPSQMGSLIAIESNDPSVFHQFSSFTANRPGQVGVWSCTSAIEAIIVSALRLKKGDQDEKVDSVKRTDDGGIKKAENSSSLCVLDQMAEVGWLRSDGYLLSRLTPGDSFLMPPPLPLFHDLKDQLMPFLWNPTTSSGPQTLEARLGPFYALSQQNPQLYSSLRILDRHGNRRLMRYLLQRGYYLILPDHMSSAFYALRQCLLTFTNSNAWEEGKTVKDGVESVEEAFDMLSKALLRFEQHWLEMPMPSVALFLSPMSKNDDLHPVEDIVGEPTSFSENWILNALTSYYDDGVEDPNIMHSASQGVEVRVLKKRSVDSSAHGIVKHLQEYMMECITTFTN